MAMTESEPRAKADLQDRLLRSAGMSEAAVDRFYRPIVELGLEDNAAKLDAYGYTVVPPDKVAPPDFLERIRSAVLRLAHERTGYEHSLDRNSDAPGDVNSSQYSMFYLLFEDEVFEDWLENETLMALVGYVMRGQAQLSSLSSFVKWKGGDYGPGLGLHSDSPATPEGRLPTDYDAICNAALCLSDYTREGGALAIVPGSHRLARQPGKGEGVDAAVPVEAAAGSLIFWHGNTWHGAFPRTIDGLRLNLTSYFCNRAFKTQERYQQHVPDEVLARHGSRFARLMGADDFYGWGKEGPGPGALRAATFRSRIRDAKA